MKHLAVLVAITLITGCSTLPKKVPLETHIVTQTEYVIKIPPAELMTLPAVVPNINVDTATQADVAGWSLAKEQYVRELENKLKGIAGFFMDQQSQLNTAAKTQNIQSQQAAVSADVQSAKDVDSKKVDLNAKPQ